ncbi:MULTISPECIES: hypothetical protein [Rhodanobacter]|uniref:hypothetical protein n=1 Tax=Rhodanobacter TaxID=75309 RepID=UPI001229FE9D|nr:MULTISPECIES: hypothetical protein [Rhodanobacter]TAN17496.1 MAG: hypothetical protein EPN35_07135 [Rhodanobacter sp.]UJJ56441.1 hypothetical protein LRK53_08740 [Rhodanobacter thiooxydans]
MPETFRAVRFHRMGNPPEVLVVDYLPFRELKTDEVRIHVMAFSPSVAPTGRSSAETVISRRSSRSALAPICSGTVMAMGSRTDRSGDMPGGATSTAAEFPRHFSGDRHWAGLDFLGPTRRSVPHDPGPTGATGLALDMVA